MSEENKRYRLMRDEFGEWYLVLDKDADLFDKLTGENRVDSLTLDQERWIYGMAINGSPESITFELPKSDNEMKYIPKGGMCASCKNSTNNCGNLDFASMPVIIREDGVAIVICQEFERDNRDG